VVHTHEVIDRQPEIIILSWCGKKADRASVCGRPGWQDLPAVRDGQVHEISSDDILQPGPRLLKGFGRLCEIVSGSPVCSRS
jgi:iron complex transport system substrate-binding protein